MPKIIFSEGPHAGTELELKADDVVIGRHDDCDFVLKDDLTSGHHARLHADDGNWLISDLDSTNGTFVNGDRITSVVLRDHDEIQIGHVRAVFLSSDESAVRGARQEQQVAEAEPGDLAVKPPQRVGKVRLKTTPSEVALASDQDLALVEQMSNHTATILQEAAKVIVGQTEVLNQVLMCMIASGHALLIGMPGMAKTLMVSTIGKVLDLDFKRIQFTPDLMPTDITGTEVLETNKETMEKEFKFVQGPIFCNLLLADEINRTPPKTQAALLEAMQEKRVTVGSNTYTLDKPFFVLATQNPIEQEGTYPLPEAQMDRFMFNIWVDYPLEHEEEQIVSTTTTGQEIQPKKVLSKEQVIQLQRVVRKIPVSEHVIKYSIRLVRATRPANEQAPDFVKEYVSIGAGPRAGQYLILAAKARAVLEGRIHVSCNDIRNAAIPVLRHRIYTNFAADSEGLKSMDIVKKLLEAVEQPSEKDYPS